MPETSDSVSVRAANATPRSGDRRPQPFLDHSRTAQPVDQQVAQALADIATIGILQERALSDGHVVTSQLEAALESRVLIEQARGIVAEHHHVSVDDAFTLLRAYARKHNRLLRQTANDIIDGTLDPDALAESTLSRRT